MNSKFNNKPPSFALGPFYLFRTLKASQVQSKFSFMLKIILSSLFLVCFSPANAALTDGLVAYWSFDDCTAKDDSGNGHDGIIVGNLECIIGVDGKKAFHFKGTEYITTGYQQVNVTAYSVSAWIKIATTENGGGIAESRGAEFSGAKSLSLVSMPPPGGYPYDTTFGVHGDRIILGKRSPKLLNDNVWHHLVGTWAATSGVKVIPSQFNLFMDGVKISEEIDSGAIITSPLSGVGNMVIGRYEAWRNFFTGIIDNVGIYNRALTDAEVTALYQQGQNKITPIVKNGDFSQKLGQDNWRITTSSFLPCNISMIPDTQNTNNTVLQMQNDGGATLCVIEQAITANLLAYTNYTLTYNYKTNIPLSCFGVSLDGKNHHG
ncbi:MAG: LamG domain-containing protein [Methylococcaceae bacterium]